MITLLLLTNTFFTDINYDKNLVNDYVIENIIAFTKSPDKIDLKKIKNKNDKYCEQVYLEATRRREYTQKELNFCENHFAMKREQEIDYVRYMQNNRKLTE